MMATFFRPTADRRKILIEDGAFPSDTYAAQSQLAFTASTEVQGLIRVAPRPGEALLRTEDLIELIERRGNEIALVLLPGVQYYTGQLLDIASITEAARRQGVRRRLGPRACRGNVRPSPRLDVVLRVCLQYSRRPRGRSRGLLRHERHGET